jgi:hypothetical protein
MEHDLRGWLGEFDVYIKPVGGDWEHDQHINNMITDSGLNLIRESLRGTITNSEIKFIAVGSGSASVSATDTQLGAEFFRKAVYSKTAVSTGVLQTIAILTETEAVAQIYEVGVFAGATATTATNSGVMISRILYSRNKTNLESVQFQRTDTIARG